MGTRGETKNIALSQGAYKDLDKEETYFPYQIDYRNGYQTDAGYWARRPGYDEWRDTGVDESIHCLIPKGNGYAITMTGRVFSLSASPLELTGATLTGIYRPTWVHFNDMTIVCDGGNPIKIEGTAALLGGSPVMARFVDIVSNYCIMSGHGDGREFVWSASGNSENWTTGDSGSEYIKYDGDTIRFMKVFKEKVFFFKDRSIEVWYNRGGG